MNPYENVTYPSGDPHAPDTAEETTTCPHCDHEQPEHFQRYCDNCGRLMTDGVLSFGGDD